MTVIVCYRDARKTVNPPFIVIGSYVWYMSRREIDSYERFIDQPDRFSDVSPPPPPEPIYDLTTSDDTELVKAAGPIERGENP